MALSGHKISLEHIINMVYRDTQDENAVNFSDMVEWAGEAMDFIGVPMSLEEKVATESKYDSSKKPYITVSDYKAFLPCDWVELIGVRDYDTKIPLVYSSDSFHNTSDHVEEETSFLNTTGEKTYKVKGNCMYTSFKTGKIEVKYLGYSTDDNGYPLIPSETRYAKAVQAYLQYRLDYILYRKGLINERIYRDSEQDWLFRVGSAATKAQTPSIDQMESWKNQMLRLIPEVNAHDTSFRQNSSQERKYNHD